VRLVRIKNRSLLNGNGYGVVWIIQPIQTLKTMTAPTIRTPTTKPNPRNVVTAYAGCTQGVAAPMPVQIFFRLTP